MCLPLAPENVRPVRIRRKANRGLKNDENNTFESNMCSIDAQGGGKFFSMCRNKIGEIAERCFQNFMERIASLMPTDKKPSHSNLEDFHDSRDYTPLKNSIIEDEPGQSSSEKLEIADRKPQSQFEIKMTDRKPSHLNLEVHDTRDYTPPRKFNARR